MITTVVFDADDTLVDLWPAVRVGLRAVLAEVRRLAPDAPLTLADLQADAEVAFVERAAEETVAIRRYAFARSLARVGLDGELDRITELFFARRFAATRAYADVPAVLTELGRSYAMGYATNGNTRTHRVGLAGRFAFEVYAHVDGVPKKPDGAFFDAVLAGAGCRPDAVVHVGDNWDHDVAAAAAAGLRTVWLNRAGRPRPPEARVAPDAEIRSLTDLPTALTHL